MVVGQQDLVRTIETLSYKALPALERRYYDGWLLRYANGYTRRANSVNPIYGSHEDIDLKISHCEVLYKHKGRPTIFKMTNNVHPADLDKTLADKGYHREAETGVYTLSIIGQGKMAESVQINSRLTDAWVDDFARLNNVSDENALTLTRMLKLIPTTCGFLQVLDGDSVIGVALGVVDETWVGVFDVVVDNSYRGQGYGRAIMQSLFAWGVAQGADTAYLQMQADNTVADKLYQSLGFQHQYNYWYRVKSLG